MRTGSSLLSTFSLAFSLSAMALSFGACKKPEYPACKKDKHCNQEMGETCVEKQCQNCQTDADCAGKGAEGANLSCVEFRCQDGAGPGQAGGGNQGDPCSQLTDCFGGLACKGGVCDACTEDFDCSPRTCEVATGRCSADGACQVDDECPMDEICDGGICVFSGDYTDGAGEEVCGFASIFFGFDSDKITEANMAKLTEAASCLSGQEKSLILEAHADNVGTQEYNILLTDKRGNAVKGVLEQLGVPTDKIQVVGKGSLTATGNDEPSRAKDRRVDFIWQ